MIDSLIHRARIAQATIYQASQERADELVRAAAWAILEPNRNRELAEMAVRDTGIGNVDDKILKNHRQTLGLLRDLNGRKTAGVLRVIVNQPHCIATGGRFENGLPFSLSMGCGTWGKNIFSSNMNVEHYMNVTRINTPIQKPIPSVDELLSAHFEKYGR